MDFHSDRADVLYFCSNIYWAGIRCRRPSQQSTGGRTLLAVPSLAWSSHVFSSSHVSRPDPILVREYETRTCSWHPWIFGRASEPGPPLAIPPAPGISGLSSTRTQRRQGATMPVGVHLELEFSRKHSCLWDTRRFAGGGLGSRYLLNCPERRASQQHERFIICSGRRQPPCAAARHTEGHTCPPVLAHCWAPV